MKEGNSVLSVVSLGTSNQNWKAFSIKDLIFFTLLGLLQLAALIQNFKSNQNVENTRSNTAPGWQINEMEMVSTKCLKHQKLMPCDMFHWQFYQGGLSYDRLNFLL
jgi:hypothetical protein